MKKNLLVLDDTSMNITRDDGFVFRREDPNDKNFMIEYLELWKKCFGESEKCSREWYEWINLNCPSGNNNLYVARDETTNKLVSAYGMLPFEVVKKGKLDSKTNRISLTKLPSGTYTIHVNGSQETLRFVKK